MIHRVKTLPHSIYGVLCCLIFLGTFPCVFCPSIAGATPQNTHDCCPEHTPKNQSDTDQSHKDDSCCVFSGFCEVATQPVVHDNSPEKVLTWLPPAIGELYGSTFTELPSLHHLTNSVSTSPPGKSISSTRRLALLQRFLI